MTTYVVTGPDGKKYKVTGEGTQEEALAQVQASLEKPKPDLAKTALSGVNRGIAGVAGLVPDFTENVINLGIAGYGTAKQAITGKPGPDLINLPGTSQWIADRWEQGGIPTSNQNPEDRASRMVYTAGNVVGGSMGGRPVPTALAAGAAAGAQEALGPEYAAPAALAAGGFSQAVQAAKQRRLQEMQARNAPRDAAVREAQEAGYTLPPSQANPSWWNKALEGFAGKVSTAQHASQKNQEITNVLAKRSLGLADDAALSEGVLVNIRNEAGKAYQAIKDFGGGRVKFRPDQQFADEVNAIGGDYAKAAKEVPELAQIKAVDDLKAALQKPISPTAAVELSKKLRHDASVNFKAYDNPEKQALAKGQRAAANAIEGLVERNLAKAGQGDLVRQYREARTTIARTHDLEAALHGDNIDAKVIAKIADKKAVGPEYEKIANFSDRFPKASQLPEKMGSVLGLSPLDFMFGGAGYFLDPTLAAMAASRPAARYGILSQPYQSMMRPSYNAPVESDAALWLRPSILANQ